MGKEISFEILAPGIWNETPISKDTLKSVVKNFKALKDVHKPFLKLGHNDEQNVTDGQPALGWISEVWIASGKLMAKAVDVPEILYEAITKQLYKHVSVELSLGVNYKGKEIGDVLTAVAILGADVPAVNTLADLKTYMSSKGIFTEAEKVSLTAVTTDYKQRGDNTMDKELKELNDKFDKLFAQLTTVQADNAELKNQLAAATASNAEFKAAAELKAKADKEAAVKTARKAVEDILEEGVTSKSITPAQRTEFSTLLQVSDDEAVQKVDIELLKKMVKKGSPTFSTKNKGKGKGAMGSTDELLADEQMAIEVQKIQNATPGLDFASAQKMVFAADPKLARAYVDANDNLED